MSCTPKTTRTKLREIINTIVDLFRKTGSVSAVVDNGNGTATFATDSTDGLTVGDCENPFVSVGGVSYEVVSFTNNTENSISKVSEFSLQIPSTETGIIQQGHITFGQLLCMYLEENLT